MSTMELVTGARVQTDGTLERGCVEATRAELLARFGKPGIYFAFDGANELSLAGSNWAIEFMGGEVATVYGPDPVSDVVVVPWKVGGFSGDALLLVQDALEELRAP